MVDVGDRWADPVRSGFPEHDRCFDRDLLRARADGGEPWTGEPSWRAR